MCLHIWASEQIPKFISQGQTEALWQIKTFPEQRNNPCSYILLFIYYAFLLLCSLYFGKFHLEAWRSNSLLFSESHFYIYCVGMYMYSMSSLLSKVIQFLVWLLRFTLCSVLWPLASELGEVFPYICLGEKPQWERVAFLGKEMSCAKCPPAKNELLSLMNSTLL